MGLKRRLNHFLPQVRFEQVNVIECRFLFLAISPDRPLVNNPSRCLKLPFLWQISPWPAGRVCAAHAGLAPFSVPPYLSTTGNRP